MTYYTKCCVKTCSNIFRPDCDTRFFELPLENQEILESWLYAIKFDEFSMISRNTIICSEHFRDSDYVLENGHYDLSSTAVPSVFACENKSIQSSNVIEPTTALNDSNNLHNWNNPPVINNVTKRATNKVARCSTSHTISSKNNYKITECVKTADSSLCSPQTSNSETVNNTKTKNHSSNEFIEDLFLVEKDPTDEVGNHSMVINSPSTRIPNTRHIKTTKPVVSNKCKTKIKPSWTLNQKMSLKNKIPNSFSKKLKLLGQKNRRLCLKVRDLASREQDLLDLKVKYMQLKLAVLETEHKLLQNGVDTSEYSAFHIVNEDKAISPSKDIEYDVLLECKLKEVKNSKAYIDNNSKTISPECSTHVQQSAENDSVIIL